MGKRNGTVVRALATHQCAPGSIYRLSIICGLSLLLVLILSPRGFSLDSLVFPSSSKTKFDLESEGHRFVSRNRLISVTLIKQS